MKNTVLLFLALALLSNIAIAQSPEIGTSFEFNQKTEKDAKFVLKDNYNHYLFSVINIDGMLRDNRIIIRKFDQKNKLVETFTKVFNPEDVSYLNNYLGSFESSTDKIIAITESYSKKSLKKEISKHVFDKKTASFESTVIATYAIESMSKSGTSMVRTSENNNFTGIDFIASSPKGAPEVNFITMLDVNGNILWQNEAPLDPAFSTRSLTITNSGNAVLLRAPKSWKQTTAITLISKDGKEDKSFESAINVYEPKAISIGTKDYLVAINYPDKTRSCDFENILLYDLENGKVLGNDKLTDFCKLKNIKDVLIRNITLQNNEIVVFLEGKSEIETTPVPGAPVKWDKDYKYENARIVVMSFEGKIKSDKKLINNNNLYSNFYHSYGILNIKGDFYINNGYTNSGSYSNSIIPLEAAKNYETNPNRNLDLSSAFNNSVSQKLVNQLLCYFPDNNRLVVATMTDEKEMSLINIYGLK